jgi:hypothetical protein
MFKELTVPEMQLSLWYSLITLKRTWIDTVLDSADYHQLFNSRRTGSPGSCGRSTTIACCLSGTTIKGRLTFKRRQVSIRMLAWNWQMRFLRRRKAPLREKRAERLTAALLEVLNG